MTTRIRRKKKVETVAPSERKTGMVNMARITEDTQTEIKRLQMIVDSNIAEMLEYMTAYNVSEVPARVGTFNREIPTGRTTTVIHIRELQELLDGDEFLAVVKASVTECKKFLSEKELNSVSTKTPGKPGEARAVYKPKK